MEGLGRLDDPGRYLCLYTPKSEIRAICDAQARDAVLEALAKVNCLVGKREPVPRIGFGQDV